MKSKTKSIYLASTIYIDDNDKNWKNEFISRLSYPDSPYVFLDPDPVKEPESYVVPRDKQMILCCDIFVAYIQRPSFGVAMEIFYAYQFGTKPVLIINPNLILYNDIWVIAHSHLILESVYSCTNHIQII